MHRCGGGGSYGGYECRVGENYLRGGVMATLPAFVTGNASTVLASFMDHPLKWLTGFALAYGARCAYYFEPWDWLQRTFDWFWDMLSKKSRKEVDKAMEAAVVAAKAMGLDALVPILRAGQEALRAGFDFMSSPVVRDAVFALFIVWLILRLTKR